MPSSSTRVEYTNSRNSPVNIVYPKRGSQQNGTQGFQKSNSTKGKLPISFERASQRWWDFRMDSKVLEDQFKISSLPQFRTLFRHLVMYTSLSSVIWAIFFAATRNYPAWIAGLVWSVILALCCLAFLLLSNRKAICQPNYLYMSAAFILLLAVTAGISASFLYSLLSVVGSFFLAMVVILLIYLLLPIPIPIVLAISAVFSIIIAILLQVGRQRSDFYKEIQPLGETLPPQIFLILCCNIIGCHMIINLQILRRSTFLKVCHLVKAEQAKRSEEKFKNLMIESVMPLSVAQKLMVRDNIEGKLFRPFTMDRMDNVSILYADIVGFTQMSSNKTAEELVILLNNLFARFDKLCNKTGCEKISTLGDCYYCVAGCPVGRKDHAVCCVEMGLGMVDAIKEFCRQNNINVNMRVGIHTGYVLCGVVGTRRYKFDVWSNDVSLANGMEQHGIPGRVHISKATLDCLEDSYIVEDSKLEERDAEFMKKTGPTYLIVDRKKQIELPNNVRKNGQSINNNLELNHSTKDPLLTKRTSTACGSRQAGQGNASDEDDCDPASKFKQDQLSKYLEQHIDPLLFGTGALLKLRKEEDDLKFLESIKNDPYVKTVYENTRVSPVTLSFKRASTENDYRSLCQQETQSDATISYSISTRYRFFWDILVTTVLTLLLFVSSIFFLENVYAHVAWISVFVLLFVVGLFATVSAGLYVFHTSDLRDSCVFPILTFFASWPARHVLGSIFLLFPGAIAFSIIGNVYDKTVCTTYLLTFIVAIAHFLNYNQLSTWLRTCMSAGVAAAVLVVIYLVLIPKCPADFSGPFVIMKYEYIIVFVLLVIFVLIINRHFELCYRLDFSIDKENQEKTEEIKTEKDKAEELLRNFIPEHVRKAMENKELYSKTHKKVGVIFGTIVNFNELYEESFLGGKEFLRFLSELISDVDELLDKDKYKDIEKIKTIGTTFMLASGLNPDVDQESDDKESHLCKLMEFCIDMQNTVDNFNKDMLNFHLVLRIGFNHGEVTAGVIGTTKQLYDIWGDTVNIASRMDSTGVPGRVQVSEESKRVLEKHFNFSYSGEKFVKGKGKMNTYLLVRDDEHLRTIKPNPTQDYPLF